MPEQPLEYYYVRCDSGIESLADLPGKETDYVLEFEEPSYLTLGLCYEQNGRFAGGAYHPLLKRVDEFLDLTLAQALEKRTKIASRAGWAHTLAHMGCSACGCDR